MASTDRIPDDNNNNNNNNQDQDLHQDQGKSTGLPDPDTKIGGGIKDIARKYWIPAAHTVLCLGAIALAAFGISRSSRLETRVEQLESYRYHTSYLLDAVRDNLMEHRTMS